MSDIDRRLIDVDAERRLLGAGISRASDWARIRAVVEPGDFGVAGHRLVAEALDALVDVGPFYAGMAWEHYEAIGALLGGREPPSSHHVRASAVDAYLSVLGPSTAPTKAMRRLVWMADGRWEHDARVVRGHAIVRAQIEEMRAEARALLEPGTVWAS